jgi:hypothetical protein
MELVRSLAPRVFAVEINSDCESEFMDSLAQSSTTSTSYEVDMLSVFSNSVHFLRAIHFSLFNHAELFARISEVHRHSLTQVSITGCNAAPENLERDVQIFGNALVNLPNLNWLGAMRSVLAVRAAMFTKQHSHSLERVHMERSGALCLEYALELTTAMQRNRLRELFIGRNVEQFPECSHAVWTSVASAIAKGVKVTRLQIFGMDSDRADTRTYLNSARAFAAALRNVLPDSTKRSEYATPMQESAIMFWSGSEDNSEDESENLQIQTQQCQL